MACHHLTMGEVGRTMDVLGVDRVTLSRPSGEAYWTAEAATDDGFTMTATDKLPGDALELLIRAAFTYRREQRRKGLANA